MDTARDHGVTRLYSYQPTLNNLEEILQENHIHCSNPKNFNDPWDCKPYFDPASLDDPEQRRKWICFFKAKHAGLTTHQQSYILQQHGPEWFENTTLLQQCIWELTQSVWQNNDERYRIFCLTTEPTLLLMWAHYGNKHQGICLEFDATAEKVWQARRCVYVDKVPLLNADIMANHIALLEASLLTKSTEWCYEKEYRLLARDGKLDPSFALVTEGNILKLPRGAITAVIAGSRAKMNEIREIVQRAAPGVPVKRAMQRANQYHLDIVDDCCSF